MIDGQGWRRTRGMSGVRTVGAALALAGLLAVGAVGNTGGVRAQETATPEKSMPTGVPTVSVSGHGQVNVPPTRPPSPLALT